jgi:beta-lactam-binding protein with PASTA domain
MYAGSAPWAPSTLDVGHDDYYAANHPGCLDLSGSAYLTSGQTVPTTTAVTVGTTAVTTVATVSTTTSTTSTLPGCTVPNVRGRTLAAARSALAASSCRTGAVKRAYSAKVKAGRVISQKPVAGKTLARGSKVDLVVSRGRPR